MTPAAEYELLESYVLSARSRGSLTADAEAGIIDRMQDLWLMMSEEDTAKAEVRAARINAARDARQAPPMDLLPDDIVDLDLDESEDTEPRVYGKAA